MKVIIEKELEDFWFGDELEFIELSDKEIIEVLQEDLSELLNNAIWTIKRKRKTKGKLI